MNGFKNSKMYTYDHNNVNKQNIFLGDRSKNTSVVCIRSLKTKALKRPKKNVFIHFKLFITSNSSEFLHIIHSSRPLLLSRAHRRVHIDGKKDDKVPHSIQLHYLRNVNAF